MDINLQILDVISVVIVCMLAGYSIGYYHAHRHFNEERWDIELLLKAIKRDTEDKDD